MLQTDTVAAIQATAIREWADLFNWPALTATGLRVAGALVVAVIATVGPNTRRPRPATAAPSFG